MVANITNVARWAIIGSLNFAAIRARAPEERMTLPEASPFTPSIRLMACTNPVTANTVNTIPTGAQTKAKSTTGTSTRSIHIPKTAMPKSVAMAATASRILGDVDRPKSSIKPKTNTGIVHSKSSTSIFPPEIKIVMKIANSTALPPRRGVGN